MKLILAQGNPGKEYEGTRHNIGFAVLNDIAAQSSSSFTEKTKFHAEVAEVVIKGEKILLAKPTTFYNETGTAARAIVDFYKINPATDILVIHDELALPFGVLKTRASGSDAGNNGIKSLNRHLGAEYNRLRIGIANPLRDHIDDSTFVLGKFTAEEREKLPQILTHARTIAEQFTKGTFNPTRMSTTLT